MYSPASLCPMLQPMSRVRYILFAGVIGLTFSAAPASCETDLIGQVTVSSDVRPSHLIVYLGNPPPRPKSSSSRPEIMDQRNQAFHPHVLAIVQGTTVKFLNSDRVSHNVFSPSPTRTFDLGRVVPRYFRQVTFKKPGVVEVLCAIHSRMLAYIRVMEHPYFASPDARGQFTIKDVPPGAYQLRVWHESLDEISKEVKVTTERLAPIQVSFPR